MVNSERAAGMPYLRTNSHATWTCCWWWNSSARSVVSTNLSSSSFTALLLEVMRVGRRQRQPEHLAQLGDLRPGGLRERRLAVEGVQHDALEQVAKRDV